MPAKRGIRIYFYCVKAFLFEVDKKYQIGTLWHNTNRNTMTRPMSKFRTPKGETEAEAEAEAETWHAYLWDQFKGS
jgi:hypothetical protein